MTRRTTAALALLATLLLHACGGGQAPTGSASRPDVLLVTLDTTRADRLGCYGYADASTPSLDRLAAEGTRFAAAYGPSPMTLPAHATMFTGLEPPEHGLRVNGRQRLPDGIPTLAATLRDHGYRTGAFVAAYVLARRFGLDRGFDVYDDDLEGALPQTVREPLSVHRPGDAVTAAALDWIGAARRDGAPFFAWVHLYDAHYPHRANAALDATRYAGVASYDAEIAFVDRQVGRLLALLEEGGRLDRTLIVAVGDHGEGLGEHGDQEHGYLLNEEVLHVPLLVRWPAAVARGHVVDGMATLRDLMPTILDLAGAAQAPAADGPGRSLRAALGGGDAPARSAYAETDLPYAVFGWSPLRSLTTERWKYVRTPRVELYDRAADRGERRNLAAEQPDVVAALERELTAMEATFRPATAPAVPIDAAARAKLEALGYVDASPGAPPPSSGLRDVKDMLAVKQLGNEIAAGLATRRLDQATAIAMTRSLVAQSPESAAFQLRLGTLLLAAGNTTEAVAALAEAVRLRPDQAEARTNLAQALVRDGRLEDALPHYRAAIALDADLAEAHLGLGGALAAQGSLEEALVQLRDAVRLAPESADARLNLGNVLLRRGDELEAAAAYRDAIRLRPDFALAHHDLATLLSRGDDIDAALHHAREAVRLAPRLAPAQHLLGRLLAEAGALDEAIAAYRTAVDLDPSAPEFLDDLAAAYAARGDTAQAVATARRAMAKANAAGRPTLAREIRQRLAFYRTHAQDLRAATP